jgi:hemoglobin/transferrin/lactoferrin receptor protein
MSLFSQSITVRDKTTFKPIKDVFIYSKDMKATTLSDSLGKIDLSIFNNFDTLIFQHPSYDRLIANIDSLQLRSSTFLKSTFHKIRTIEIKETRWKERAIDIAQVRTRVSAADIELENPQTGADLLASSGQVYVQKSQMGGGSPMMRGFAANRVLLVVDDIRINNAIFRSGNLQNAIMIDPLNIEHTDIIFGPGSAIYGSDALGGVMSFDTKNPSIDSSKNVYGSIYSRYSSASNEKTIHGDIGFNTGQFAFLTNVTFSDFDNLKMGSIGPDDYLRNNYIETINGIDSIIINKEPQLQINTGYSQMNISQKVLFQVNNKSSLLYSLFYTTSTDIPRYDRLIETRNGNLRNSEWYYGPQKLLMNTLKYNLNSRSLFFDSLQALVSIQQYQESRHDRRYQSDILRHRTENVDVYTGNLSMVKRFSKKLNLFYGLEANLNDIRSTANSESLLDGSEAIVNPRYPKSTWNSYASYGSMVYTSSNGSKYQASLRYNHIFIQSKFDTSLFPYPFQDIDLNFGSVSGGIGARFKLNNQLRLITNLGSGFRAPNIDDMGKLFDSEPGNVIVPNQDLRPETSYNFELGLNHTSNRSNTINIGGYTTYLNNAIERRDFQLDGQDSIYYDGEISNVQALQNASFAFIYGAYFNLKRQLFNNYSISLNLNYQKGFEELENGEFGPLRHIAPTFGEFHITYSKKIITIDISTRFMDQFRHRELAESEKAKNYIYAINQSGEVYSPAWATLNFKSNLEINPKMKIGVGIENIGDLRYRPYSSGISAPGRNFILSIKGSF